MSSRQRVETALAHRQPDRTPVDFLAVPEIWHQLVDHFGIEPAKPGDDQFFDPVWEAVLGKLDVDCRVISFDQFCSPPASAFDPKGRPEVWNVQSRSTPARMWRWKTEGFATDIFGRGFREVANASGVYEENIATLAGAGTLADAELTHWIEGDPSLRTPLTPDEPFSGSIWRSGRMTRRESCFRKSRCRKGSASVMN